jgi:oligopeptidase A
MEEILALRHELAQLLGFESYAFKSLATKMAENPQQVLDFLTDLAKRARPQGEKELAQLRAFAKAEFGVDELQPWDIAYYSEKQKQHLYSISDEQLRPYFPENKAVNGLFEVVKRIYGITAKERTDVDVWHPEVRFFELYDENNELRGSFYLDLYAREHKRGGAWMDDCVGQMRKSDGTLQKPVAYLTCNFNRPVNGKPALFTHDEVITLFHEFGHGLHHMLTRIETAGVSGINGVPWDAVELPSQFMENWCWEPEALAFISGHYETGEPLPKELLDKMLAAKNYQAALFILRQLEFGLFDFRLHAEFNPQQGAKILETLAEIKNRSPWCRAQPGAASRMPSATFLLVATRRVTTAICGPTCWRRMPSLASKMKGFSTVKPDNRSSITSSPVAVLKSRWNCSNASVAASHSWMRCWSITGLKADYSRENLLN